MQPDIQQFRQQGETEIPVKEANKETTLQELNFFFSQDSQKLYDFYDWCIAIKPSVLFTVQML